MSDQPDPIDKFVGERLRAFRKSRRLSLSDLGCRSGVTYQQIQKYEHGTNRVSASQLWRLSKALHVGVGAFFPDDSDAPDADALRWAAAIGRLKPEVRPVIVAPIDAIAATLRR